ncbi:PKD domain-containing protein [Mucilaginibacter mali]|uniref:PKD domain-containing protein n=1 Tax=Mucilaginibacter mali TaxID=2740462 RepID=A0A7D4TW24_9SPHI|nr:PKD domain-containing protein [Mucilaginibacter mali]QKJ29077.1 PKD domain-containing protein [Mucilaginibacter mali]
MSHVDGTGSSMSLYITGDITTTGTVSFADGTTASIPFNVTANKVTIVNIPTSVYLSSAGQIAKGIYITSAKNIVVYAHIYHASRSGATLVLPVNAMGKDYYSINYTQKPTSAYSVFCVIATEDNTTVEITPSAKLTTGQAAKTAFNISLRKGEVYQALSSTDLTGSHIRSISSGTEPCKKIAVYSGSTWLAINCNTAQGAKASADNLFQQVYPTAAWGKNYVTAPLAGRNYDVFRIIYSDPTAKVTLNGTLIQSNQLINNLYYEFNSQSSNVITSDKPIQVAQYAVTQNATINCVDNLAETIGDPEMIFLSPIEQGLDHVTLYSTDQQVIVQSYINVIIPTTAVSSFVLDGASYTNFSSINTTYSYAQIPVKSGPTLGTHNISASAPFNAIAYGFGQFESYGYAAGTDLKNLNEFINLQDAATNSIVSQGCAGVTYKPRVIIPYQTTKITWDMKDGKTPVAITYAQPDSTLTKNGQTLYLYNYSSTISYNTPGNYSIVATVFNQNADDCGSNEDIEFDYTISDVPTANFTHSVKPTGTCPGDEVTFTDTTDPKTVGIKSWSWDFGDAANSTASNPNNVTNQNPKHTFIKPGDYTVMLTVQNQNGCSTTSPPQTIHVNQSPTAAFTTSTPDCETRDITFNAQASAANEGTLTTWLWDFGDGTATVQKTNGQPFPHQFAATGTYQISLTVTSSTGCSNTVINSVIVNPLPVVDFILPDVCLSDAFAQFTDKSTIADGSEGQFTWSWDFGDATRSTAINPNTSQLQNPKHQYTQVGNYTVSLTITSKNGCIVTKSQQFTVNGDTPKALFDIPAPTCSSDDALFKDNSTVNFGNITRLVWYFDYNNNPGQTVIYTKDQFPADRIYHHNYGLFNNQPSKTYAVKMEAYSGESCVSVSEVKNVVINANPYAKVTPIGPLCQEAAPVQIPVSVVYGNGTGTFSGTGVSASGLFDPAKAGPGTFNIHYTFANDNTQCAFDTTLSVTVYPTPTANAGPNLHVLQGGSITINASAGPQPLQYKWTLANGGKAIGLDHDDVLSPIASPTDDTDYMLTVTTANGCSKSSVVHVSVLKAPVVPNTFTPNNDGFNDRWEIKYLDTYPNCTVEVYNRLGEKLYSSVGYPVPWDGTYQGATLPVGTYYYIINPKNGRKVISGSITIIR